MNLVNVNHSAYPKGVIGTYRTWRSALKANQMKNRVFQMDETRLQVKKLVHIRVFQMLLPCELHFLFKEEEKGIGYVCLCNRWEKDILIMLRLTKYGVKHKCEICLTGMKSIIPHITNMFPIPHIP